MSERLTSPPSLERLFEVCLAGLVAVGFVAIAAGGGADAWTAAALSGAILWRLGRALKLFRGEPSRRLAAGPAFLILAFYPVDVTLVAGDFVTATVRMLLLFAALKLIIARAPRDYLYLALLGFLELLTASMFMEGMAYLGVLAAFLGLSMTAYVVYELRRGWNAKGRTIAPAGVRRRLAGRLARTGVGLAASVLLVASALFVVLPRPQASGGDARLFDSTAVGFSNEVDLGKIGALKSDPTPVMRVESLDGTRIDGLYWRGAALYRFDGRRWSAPGLRSRRLTAAGGGYGIRSGHGRREGEGRRVRYRVKLEPLGVDALFLAGKVEEVRGRFSSLRVSDVEIVRMGELRPGARVYEAAAWIPDRAQVRPSDVVELFSERFRSRYLELPGLDPRIAELTDRVTAGETSPLRKAERIEAHLRTEYGYTLELPVRRRTDPLAHFLFTRKEGHCEYFATAMAMMLRSEGIPSRLVNGFAGGLRIPLSGTRLLRSADAHSWVEAYVPGYGWLEFDPTPPATGWTMSAWTAELANGWEAAQVVWMEWIVGYDSENQLELARGLQASTRGVLLWAIGVWEALLTGLRTIAAGGWPEVSAWAAVLALLVLFGLAAHALFRVLPGWMRPSRRAGGGGAAGAAYERALKALAKRGFSRTEQQTAEEFQETIGDRRLRGLMRRITTAYNSARFGADREAGRRLPKLVDALERLR